MTLYRSLDYWECRELLESSANARINAEDKKQSLENKVFNSFLDQYSKQKFQWVEVGKPLNLWEIKQQSIDLLE